MKPTNQQIIEACQSELTMAKAAVKLGIHFNTLKSRAIKLGVYKPNPGGKGLICPNKTWNKIPLKEIIEGKHPQYQTNKLKIRLFETGLKEQKCEICQQTEWLNQPIPLELDHIDGNRNNHILSNLRIICPNCHAQTGTYRGRNIGNH